MSTTAQLIEQAKAQRAARQAGGSAPPAGAPPAPPAAGTQSGFFSPLTKDIAESFGKRKQNVLSAIERTDSGKQTKPEYMAQFAGEAAGGVADIISALSMFTAKKVLPQKAKSAIKDVAASAANSTGGEMASRAAGAYGEFEKGNPRAAANINSLLNIVSMLPVAKGGQVATRGAGTVIEKAGKSTLASAAKIKDTTAGAVARDVDAGIKKIINDVAKHNVQSTTGGFSGIIKNAQKKIAESDRIASDILENAAKDINTPKKDVDAIFIDLMDRAKRGDIEDIPLGDEDRAEAILSSLQKGLELKGFKGEIDVKRLNDAKKAIRSGRKLFKKGAAKMAEDPLAAKVNEIAYLRLRDEIESIVPEVRKYNQTTHDLIPVIKAAAEANKRQSNWNKITLTDMLVGAPSAMGAYQMKDPVIAGAALALLAGRRIAGRGRGPSALISTGKALQSIGGK